MPILVLRGETFLENYQIMTACRECRTLMGDRHIFLVEIQNGTLPGVRAGENPKKTGKQWLITFDEGKLLFGPQATPLVLRHFGFAFIEQQNAEQKGFSQREVQRVA